MNNLLSYLITIKSALVRHWIALCLPVFLSFYMPVCLPTFLPAFPPSFRLSALLPAFMPSYLSVCCSACLPSCLPTCASALLPSCRLYVCLSAICLNVCPFIMFPSVCLSIHLSNPPTICLSFFSICSSCLFAKTMADHSVRNKQKWQKGVQKLQPPLTIWPNN